MTKQTFDLLLSMLVWLCGALFAMGGHWTGAAILWVYASLILRGKV